MPAVPYALSELRVCITIIAQHTYNVCRMQMKLLSDPIPRLQRKQNVYALHGPNAGTELAMLATIDSLDPASLPIMTSLLQKPSALSVGPHAPSAPTQAARRPHSHAHPHDRAAATAAAQSTGTLTAEAHDPAVDLADQVIVNGESVVSQESAVQYTSPDGQGFSPNLPTQHTGAGLQQSLKHSDDDEAAAVLRGMDEDAQKIAADFKLNLEQAGVLQHCCHWATGSKVSMLLQSQ